jgi:hypothetical protein
MMMKSLELPSLYVEGQSDLHTIVQLLARHDIVLDKDSGPVSVKDAGGDNGVLGAMRTAARASTNQSVGFVVDANGSVASRWQSICDRFSNLGLDLPDVAPPDGYVGSPPETQAQVGVWIMPDNATDTGSLETLIQTLVPGDDSLFQHATSATAEAKQSHAAKFPDQDQNKAELHCWLAWQKEPGLSFGTALKVQYFAHDSNEAIAFIDWFRRLFNI